MKEKEYPPIADVMHFNRRGHGPFVETLYVRANVDPSPHYPDARIFLGATVKDSEPRDFGGVCFTLAQAKQLRKELGEAIRDVMKGCPQLVMEDVSDDDLD